ncbi:MAG: GNAT family N-acetyltransferase [Ginsengibacter sp.]
MDTLVVRPVTSKDLETLFLFEQGVIKAEHPFDPTLKPDPINYYDLAAMVDDPNVELVVAELDNEIVGSGYARIENSKPYLQHAKHAYLGFMYVKPDKRSKGIIQKIIESLKAWISSKNITELRLEVYKDNAPAIRAYEKAGFSQHMIEMRMEIEKK